MGVARGRSVPRFDGTNLYYFCDFSFPGISIAWDSGVRNSLDSLPNSKRPSPEHRPPPPRPRPTRPPTHLPRPNFHRRHDRIPHRPPSRRLRLLQHHLLPNLRRRSRHLRQLPQQRPQRPPKKLHNDRQILPPGRSRPGIRPAPSRCSGQRRPILPKRESAQVNLHAEPRVPRARTRPREQTEELPTNNQPTFGPERIRSKRLREGRDRTSPRPRQCFSVRRRVQVREDVRVAFGPGGPNVSVFIQN